MDDGTSENRKPGKRKNGVTNYVYRKKGPRRLLWSVIMGVKKKILLRKTNYNNQIDYFISL